MTIEEAFGVVVRRLRKECNCSQEKLSLSSFLDRTFISNIEGGKQQPSLVSIFALANALNVLPSKIIAEVELVLNFDAYDKTNVKARSTRNHEKPWVKNVENHMHNGDSQFKGSETILVVDDEKQVKEVISSLLRSCGYQVLTAEDGQEALEIFRQNDGVIDLVVMDVVMPRMNGFETYHEIKKINPEIGIILVSGYHSGTFSEMNNLAILQKPFSPLELMKQIRLLLDQRHREAPSEA